MSASCVCAGILVADHLCAPVPHLPAAGELVHTERLALEPGGCAANTAIALARQGVETAVVGCVGDDVLGRFLTAALDRHGVDVTGVVPRPGHDTSGTLIVNVAGEDRRFIHCVGANATLRAEDFPSGIVARAQVLYVGGYLVLPALHPRALASLLAGARASGARTVLDIVLGPEPDLWDRLEPVLPHVDVFLPNTDEARALTGKTDALEQARTFRTAGAGTVVVTRGAEGAVLASAKGSWRILAPAVPFVDGTGAGDAFAAGYIAGMLESLDPLDCLRLGTALGASCVTAVGATTSVLDRAGARDFLAATDLEIRAVP